MFTKRFWKDAAERAAKGAAHAIVLALGIGSTTVGFDVVATDWAYVGSFGLGGAVLSVLTSIISTGFNDRETASLVNNEPVVHEVHVDDAALDEDFFVNDDLPKE